MRFAFVLLALVFPAVAGAQTTVIEEIETDVLIIDEFEAGEYQIPSFEEYVEEIRPDDSSIDAAGATIRGIDRISGRLEDIHLANGETVTFERLEVRLFNCRYPDGGFEDDAYALLEIRDIREEEPRFYGWMFASSPALSSLDHPRYDIWVLKCRIASAESGSESE